MTDPIRKLAERIGSDPELFDQLEAYGSIVENDVRGSRVLRIDRIIRNERVCYWRDDWCEDGLDWQTGCGQFVAYDERPDFRAFPFCPACGCTITVEEAAHD